MKYAALIVWIVATWFAPHAVAQSFGPGGGVEISGPTAPCFGPGGCSVIVPDPSPPVEPVLPAGPCLGDAGCTTREVRHEVRQDGLYATVWLTLPNGYSQGGIAGPCWVGACPDLVNQAETEAAQKLKNGLRYERWPSP